MSTWADEAGQVIAEVHRTLPETASLAERKAAVDAAYPFGRRSHWPYKAWLRARREYLRQYGYAPKSKALIESPLERLMRRARRT